MTLPVLAVAQCGGPTAVLNASLNAAIEAADQHFAVLGVFDGPAGLAAGNLHKVDKANTPAQLPLLPGAWLGAGRYAWDAAAIEAAATGLHDRGVRHLVLIGGNGTMALGHALSEAAGDDLAVVGVPKTIDNDLAEVDHAPGFASAARFLRTVLPGLAYDQLAMRGIEPVRIVETLGRDSGWLAAAAATASGPCEIPHFVFTPEQAMTPDEMLTLIDAQLRKRGWVFGVIAEGASAALSDQEFTAVNHRRPLYGGAARQLARLVERSLGVAARGEVLGMAQRATAELAAPSDREEAARVGARAVELLVAGARGVMVAPGRRSDGKPAPLREVPLEAVAGRSRLLPDQWIPSALGVSTDFRCWLEDLLADSKGELS